MPSRTMKGKNLQTRSKGRF